MHASMYYDLYMMTEDKAMTTEVRLGIDGRAATLTTEHPQSSHNQPVLVLGGQTYGYGDRIAFRNGRGGISYTTPYLVEDRSLPQDHPICVWNRQVDQNDPLSGVDIP